jgi:hypothetical protein
MNDTLNASGSILPGALRLSHVLAAHRASTAVPMEFSSHFSGNHLVFLSRLGVVDRATMSTPFLMLVSILPASSTHRDGHGLRQMPVMTGASVISETASQ